MHTDRQFNDCTMLIVGGQSLPANINVITESNGAQLAGATSAEQGIISGNSLDFDERASIRSSNGKTKWSFCLGDVDLADQPPA